MRTEPQEIIHRRLSLTYARVLPESARLVMRHTARSAPSSLKQVLACVVALVSLTVTLAAAEGLRIVPLVRGDQVLVTFELTDGFTDEVRAAVRSGLKTTFTYIVGPASRGARVDRSDDRLRGDSNSVEYDNLTRLAQRRPSARRQGGEHGGYRQRGDGAAVDDQLRTVAAVPDVSPRAQPRVLRTHQRHCATEQRGVSVALGAAVRPARRSLPSSARPACHLGFVAGGLQVRPRYVRADAGALPALSS